ncbi:MAG: YecA family protein [Deltaproteobacteria bacterium]|nr:YecA family protein [Deltaproteobacteria bacterium]
MAKAIKRKATPEQVLESFLSERDAMSVAEVSGFIAALHAAPTLTMPSEWMPEVFNGGTPEYKDQKEARVIHKALCLDLWNDIGKALSSEHFTFAPGPEHPEKQQEWCTGYLRGVRFGNWNLDEKHRAWVFIHVFAVIAGEASAEDSIDETVDSKSIFYATSAEKWLHKQSRRLAAYGVVLYKLVRDLDVTEPVGSEKNDG